MLALRIEQVNAKPEWRDVPDPVPGPGEVVVRVGGAGLCHTDLHLTRGRRARGWSCRPPFTLGHENAGWVHAVGAGVEFVELGQPVAVHGLWGCGQCGRCRLGTDEHCERGQALGGPGAGFGRDGGLAPFMAVPAARFLVPLNRLDPVAAAPLTDAAATAYRAVARCRNLLVPGSCAVVIGADHVGRFAIQVLRATTAATIVAVGGSEQAVDVAKRAGADDAVLLDAASVAGITARTGGHNADVVLDCTGSRSSGLVATAVVRTHGHVGIVGPTVEPPTLTVADLEDGVEVVRTRVGRLSDLVEVIALAEAGFIRADVERVPFEDAHLALEDLATSTAAVDLVVTPDVDHWKRTARNVP